jgi:hypothetical protein
MSVEGREICFFRKVLVNQYWVESNSIRSLHFAIHKMDKESTTWVWPKGQKRKAKTFLGPTLILHTHTHRESNRRVKEVEKERKKWWLCTSMRLEPRRESTCIMPCPSRRFKLFSSAALFIFFLPPFMSPFLLCAYQELNYLSKKKTSFFVAHAKPSQLE